MFTIVKSYFNFLWHSKNEHGVHSPFVFSLVTKCFYDKKKYDAYSVLKKYRKALLYNNTTIEVTDFGAGSRVFKSNTRSISKIAQTAGISTERAALLFRIAQYFQPKKVLEIGTSLGLATTALAQGNKKSEIITLEGCSNTMGIAQKHWQEFGLDNIQSVATEFSAYLKSDTCQNATFDLIYFDGNHSEKATLDYFNLLLPTANNDTVWIFDDIHWSTEMENAWKTIQNHPSVKVTIDTFQWGLVFFRNEQEKEHFCIRA